MASERFSRISKQTARNTLLLTSLFRRLSNMLMNRIYEQVAFSIGVLLLILFIASLAWCGDADCPRGKSNDRCASLVCSLLNEHANRSENSKEGNAKACSCVCHSPTLSTQPLIFGYSPKGQPSSLFQSFDPPTTPTQRIYHPPKFA